MIYLLDLKKKCSCHGIYNNECYFYLDNENSTHNFMTVITFYLTSCLCNCYLLMVLTFCQFVIWYQCLISLFDITVIVNIVICWSPHGICLAQSRHIIQCPFKASSCKDGYLGGKPDQSVSILFMYSHIIHSKSMCSSPTPPPPSLKPHIALHAMLDTVPTTHHSINAMNMEAIGNE